MIRGTTNHVDGDRSVKSLESTSNHSSVNGMTNPRRRMKKKSDDELEEEMRFLLGSDCLRFGPVYQQPYSSIQDALRALKSNRKIVSYVNLKAKWELIEESKVRNQTKKNKNSKNDRRDASIKTIESSRSEEGQNYNGSFTDFQMLRFLEFAEWNHNKAADIMLKTNPRRFQLTAHDSKLERQLRTKTLFPLPGLRTMGGESSEVVFYMRPSRYTPKEMSTSSIIDNLVYVMDHCQNVVQASQMYAPRSGSQRLPTNGIAFIANMNDWTMSNFCTEYCFQFMQTLQGHKFPAKVSLFLIVNPPKWFGKIWQIMKPMLAAGFRKKVHMIDEDELWSFLEVGYEQYIPNEFVDGQADPDKIVDDFIKYKQYLEMNDCTRTIDLSKKQAETNCKIGKTTKNSSKNNRTTFMKGFLSSRRNGSAKKKTATSASSSSLCDPTSSEDESYL